MWRNPLSVFNKNSTLKRKSGATKQNREQNRSSQSLARTDKEVHENCPFKMVSRKARKTQAKAQTTPDCVTTSMGVRWCHAMVWIHVVDRRCCPVHGVDQEQICRITHWRQCTLKAMWKQESSALWGGGQIWCLGRNPAKGQISGVEYFYMIHNKIQQ